MLKKFVHFFFTHIYCGTPTRYLVPQSTFTSGSVGLLLLLICPLRIFALCFLNPKKSRFAIASLISVLIQKPYLCRRCSLFLLSLPLTYVRLARLFSLLGRGGAARHLLVI